MEFLFLLLLGEVAAMLLLGVVDLVLNTDAWLFYTELTLGIALTVTIGLLGGYGIAYLAGLLR